MPEERKFKISDVGRLLKNSFGAILKGELLMRMKIGNYFIHIVWCVAMVTLAIWVSLLIDNSLTIVERNKNTIADQEATLAMRTYELSALTRRSGMEKRLEDMGSTLREAKKPATLIQP